MAVSISHAFGYLFAHRRFVAALESPVKVGEAVAPRYAPGFCARFWRQVFGRGLDGGQCRRPFHAVIGKTALKWAMQSDACCIHSDLYDRPVEAITPAANASGRALRVSISIGPYIVVSL